jgi:cyanophycinase
LTAVARAVSLISMKTALTLVFLVLFGSVIAAQVARGPAQAPKGALVVVGGGGTGEAIMERAMSLAGGKSARLLVVPQASGAEDAGDGLKKFWEEKGATNVAVLDLSDEKRALEEVEKANFIWMGGGDQSRLMDALSKTEIPAAIRKRYRDGAVVGGTSAGAAVISHVMMIGGEKADMSAVKSGGTQTTDGLGLWPEVIVDQHFVQRKRFTRLLACVLDHPELVGVGIDEKTAVIVRGDKYEVMGESSVILIDARGSTRRETKPGEILSATDLRVHTLRPGDTFDLAVHAK